MNLNDRRIAARLRSAFEIDMGVDTRERQLTEVATALRNPTGTGRSRVHIFAIWRRSIATLLVAATFSTSAAVAVAAEGTLPGDMLYPVKHVTETLRSAVDPTVFARNRIDEADRMNEMGFSSDELEIVLIDADHAITDVGNPDELRSLLIDVRKAMSSPVVVDDVLVGDVDELPENSTGPSSNDREGAWMTGEQSESDELDEATTAEIVREQDTGTMEQDQTQLGTEGWLEDTASCSESTASPSNDASGGGADVDSDLSSDSDTDTGQVSGTWDEYGQD